MLILQLLMVPLGLVVGGVITMIATRVPDGLPVFRPGPQCPACEASLSIGEIVPVVSFVLGGRACRHCGERISVAYPVIEIVTAIAFVVASLRYGQAGFLIGHLLLFATLIAVSVTDLYLYRIPDRIVFPSLGASMVVIVATSIMMGEPQIIGTALAGSVMFFVALFAFHVVMPHGMGFGDVKLALLLGLFLGWNALGEMILVPLFIVYALFIASMLGVIGGGVLYLARRMGYDPLPDPEMHADPASELAGDDNHLQEAESGKVHTALPFGPALALGTVIVLLLSETIALNAL